VLAVSSAQPASAQTATSLSSRTSAIVASFNKSKHVVKEKRGVRLEKYKVVRSEAAIRSDRSTYSGNYHVPDFGFTLSLRVTPDGQVNGSGEDPLTDDSRINRHFIVSGKVDGALLTATKAYANGDKERLEGVFINRTSFESPTDRGFTLFGLGVTSIPREINGNTIDKLFYERKRWRNKVSRIPEEP
jgi:hypothetical protein